MRHVPGFLAGAAIAMLASVGCGNVTAVGDDGGAGTSGSAGTTGQAGTTGNGAGTSGSSAGTTGAAGTSGTNGGAGTNGRGGTGGRGGMGGGPPPCPASGCQPLLIADLTGIATATVSGFDTIGFRCKAFTVCGVAMSCIYSATDNLGFKQSMEDAYTDGIELATPVPAKIKLDLGSNSQCTSTPATFKEGDYVTLTFDGGRQLPVFLPAFTGTSLTLYIATDGSTYKDAALTMPAGKRP